MSTPPHQSFRLRPRLPSRAALLAIAMATAAPLHSTLHAHGGQYRGPQLQPGMPVVPRMTTGPATGAPTPPTAGPTTGARDLVPDARTWQTWWEFNKEPYLVPRIEEALRPVTGSDDFYLGARKPSGRVDLLRPNDVDRSDRIVPALVALLDADRNRDIQSACLIALGKLGLDPNSAKLDDVLAERIARGDQEVRETAVLAIGIAGRAQGFDVLESLLTDAAAGRKLAERSEVRDRTRAFAAYGIGLLARRVGDAALSQRAHDVLWSVLADDDDDDRDLRTAIVTALGSLRADPERSSDKRLAWLAAERLLAWFERDLGVTDESVQAHAPIAIARLLGRGSSPVHRRCKERFAAALEAKKRRGPPIAQSCAVALGMLALPVEQEAADERFSEVLQAYWKDGRDQTARQLSVISLGRIGGLQNRDWLAKAYARGNKGIERPWLALALGVLCERVAAAGTPDATIGEMLLQDLEDASTDDLRSALAIAVGLTGYKVAAPRLQRLLRDHEADVRSAAYLSIGVGLLGDRSATPMLTAVLKRSGRRPFLLQQCAVALGCLGDRAANEVLVEMLREADSVAVLAAIASSIGRIGDRRAIDPLVELSRDRELAKIGRAFVAAALGGVGDRDEMPWNTPLSVDCNYATGMDTLTNGSTGVLDIL